MTLVMFFGCSFIAFGPALALYLFTIATEPLRIIFLIVGRASEGLKILNPEEAAPSMRLLAYVSGLGFGIMSGVFSFVNTLPNSLGPGTVGIHGDSPHFFLNSDLPELPLQRGPGVGLRHHGAHGRLGLLCLGRQLPQPEALPALPGQGLPAVQPARQIAALPHAAGCVLRGSTTVPLPKKRKEKKKEKKRKRKKKQIKRSLSKWNLENSQKPPENSLGREEEAEGWRPLSQPLLSKSAPDGPTLAHCGPVTYRRLKGCHFCQPLLTSFTGTQFRENWMDCELSDESSQAFFPSPHTPFTLAMAFRGFASGFLLLLLFEHRFSFSDFTNSFLASGEGILKPRSLVQLLSSGVLKVLATGDCRAVLASPH
ncbi:gamma-secretase subunit APH-1B isoform X2 [Erinaceus europaeus]|uniref:Gamma-secretase subunit APH-1 n=1 Tax=Erinaceus europaeus TaxID=9365 RepID=A0ABM3W1A0_ERIEU|nr:gamma-secretase subunit APH-1B isoform X2 [Erinaceus europaeus]